MCWLRTEKGLNGKLIQTQRQATLQNVSLPPHTSPPPFWSAWFFSLRREKKHNSCMTSGLEAIIPPNSILTFYSPSFLCLAFGLWWEKKEPRGKKSLVLEMHLNLILVVAINLNHSDNQTQNKRINQTQDILLLFDCFLLCEILSIARCLSRDRWGGGSTCGERHPPWAPRVLRAAHGIFPGHVPTAGVGRCRRHCVDTATQKERYCECVCICVRVEGFSEFLACIWHLLCSLKL